MSGTDELDLKEYKNIETKLYGELMKTCRRYTRDLNLISILGILEIVSQETKDLDKTGRSLMQSRAISDNDSSSDKENLESIL